MKPNKTWLVIAAAAAVLMLGACGSAESNETGTTPEVKIEGGNVSVGDGKNKVEVKDGGVSVGNDKDKVEIKDGNISVGNDKDKVEIKDGNISVGNDKDKVEIKDGNISVSNNTAGSNNTTSASAGVENNKRPEHLPADFPIPEGAVITTATSSQDDGKKSAMLIFKVEGKTVADLAKTYKDYLKQVKVEDLSDMVDEKNIILTGDSAKDSWSIIGGQLASDNKTIEFIVTWAELGEKKD